MLVENMFNMIFPWFITTVRTYREQSVHYVEIALELLDTLNRVRMRHICEADSLQSILSPLLYIFGAWVLMEYLPQSDTKSLDDFTPCEKCDKIGKEFRLNTFTHSIGPRSFRTTQLV